MAPKRKGPLQVLQRQTDEIKKQADEPAPVGSYAQRKLEEERRLLGLEERLKALSLELSPAQRLDTGEAGPSQAREEDSEEEEDEESEEEEEDDDDDDDDEGEIPEPGDDTYVSISTLKGHQEGDLSIAEGEVLKILRRSEDGWWLAQNPAGRTGLVPKTYLEKYALADEDDENDDEEESEDEGEELDEAKERRSSAPMSNWASVRKAVTEMDTTDVLSAMGAIPAGFRPSTLSKLLEESVTYRGSRYIQPELSQSKLSFKDLFLDPDTGKVRARAVRSSVCVSLWSCRMIPPPGVGVHVLSRHVRLCAFDGVKVLSNIHTVRATYNSKSPKTWTFSPRMTGPLPSLLDGDCFLRCDSDSPDLGVLFELGVTFIRNSTGERGELSCGWAFLKLFDASGAPLPARTYELTVNGGTPYEKDVSVDPSVSRGATGSVLQQMLQARKQPKLIVKLRSANARTRAQLSVVPDTLVGCLSCVHLLALHRQILADTLLMDRATMHNADVICSPLLASFSEVVDQPDVLDALRTSWLEAERHMSRANKRDLPLLKGAFVKVYMDAVYPLLRLAELPAPRWGDAQTEDQRARLIYARLRPDPDAEPTTPASLPPGGHSGQQAFDIAELTYDLLHMAR